MIATLDRPIVPINELISMKVISDFLESDRFDSTVSTRFVVRAIAVSEINSASWS